MNKKELDNLILNEIFGFGKKKEKPPRDNVEAIRQSIAAMRRGAEGDKLTDEEIESTLRDAGFSVADIKKAKEPPTDSSKGNSDKSNQPKMPGIISKGSPLYNKPIAKAARGDASALEALLALPYREKFRQGEFFDKLDLNLDDYEKSIKRKRNKMGSPVSFNKQISALRRIRSGGALLPKNPDKYIRDTIQSAELGGDQDFADVARVYAKLFMSDDQSPKAAEPKEEPSPKALPPGETRKALPPGSSPKELPPGSSPKELPPGSSPKELPPGEDTGGGDTPSPKRAKKKGEPKPASGELKPVSGELKPVSGELKPVNTDIEEVPEKQKQKQKGTSLRLDPKRLSDRRYVKEFAKLVADYVMLSPQSEPERERQNSKILDLKKQMNDLMRQRTPGAIDLQKAIRDEIAPLQRRMQQIAESYVKNNFEQIIREELENYIKEKK